MPENPPELGNVWGRFHTRALWPLLLGAFLPPLDYFIVNLALPSMRASLAASDSVLQLVVSAYASAYAIGLITGGRLGDKLGRKRVFMLGLVAFVGASLICGFSVNGYQLVAGRILQRLSASVMAPQVLATIRAVYVLEHHTRITAFYGFVFGLAAIVGQIGGGALIALDAFGLGWRMIFLINLPLGAIAVIGARLGVPENRGNVHAGFDVVGVLLLTAMLAMIIYPLSRGAEDGWPAWTFVALATSLPTLWAFVRTENRLAADGGDPLIDFKIFSQPVVSLGLSLAFLFYMDSVFFMVFGIYLQTGLGRSALDAGLLLLPFAAGFATGPLLTPKIVAKAGDLVLPLGFTLMAVGFGLLAVLLVRVGDVLLGTSATLLIAGIGHGIVLPSLTRIVLSHAARERAGLVSGLLISTLQVGSSCGVAILGGLFFSVLGGRSGATVYAFAFSVALSALVGLMLACIGLSTWLTSLAARARTLTSAATLGNTESSP